MLGICRHEDLLRASPDVATEAGYRRQCLEVEVEWQKKKIRIVVTHSPVSGKRRLSAGDREKIFSALMDIVGARLGGGAEEPAAWIIGGDMSVETSCLGTLCTPYQPSGVDVSGTNVGGRYIEKCVSHHVHHRHGDIALCQGLWAYQLNSGIGASYGGISVVHDAVNVFVSLPGSSGAGSSSGVLSPTGGGSGSGGAAEPLAREQRKRDLSLIHI